MVKVLLIFEDFNQLTLAEVCLKKVGFDVLGVTNDTGLSDKLLGFPADVIVVAGKGQRVNSITIGQKLKEQIRFSGKVVLGIPNGLTPTPAELLKVKMDSAAEMPIHPEKLIRVISKVSKLNADLFVEKYVKLTSSDKDLSAKIQALFGILTHQEKFQIKKDLINDPLRIKKYQKFIDEAPPLIEGSTHQKEKVKAAQEALKKSWNFDKIEEQDELRRKFAEALFKKK